MRTLYFSRNAVVATAAMLLFAGCGAAQNNVSPVEMISSHPIASGHRANKSWIQAGASASDLVYALGGCIGTCIFSYPARKLVGSLNLGGPGICSDSAGNVYVVHDASVYEYAHGGTSPIETFDIPGSVLGAFGCAVDPASGDVAVAFLSTTTNVAVFPGDGSTPTLYTAPLEPSYCGFDDEGNLFVDGDASGGVYALAELKARSSNFISLSLDQSVGVPGQIQWDGKYLTYQGITPGNVIISRLSVSGSQTTIVGTTHFNIRRQARASWIHGSDIFIPYGTQQGHGKANRLGVWSYPAGGSIKGRLDKFGHYAKQESFGGITYSAAN